MPIIKPKDRLPTLRGRLLAGSLFLIIVGGLFSGYANYTDSQEEVEELFDAEMAQMARTLQGIFSSYLQSPSLNQAKEPLTYEDHTDLFPAENPKEGEENHEITAYGHRYEKKLAFQIWRQPGTLLIQTRSAQTIQLPMQPEGFSNLELGGEPWRIFALHDAVNQRWIQVAQRDDVRRELALEVALHALATPMLTIPLLGVFLWLLVSASLRPLESLSRHVAGRAPFDATPLSLSGALQETRPLIDALNGLFARVQAQAERERQFTADAAHELRTPPAAIKINLQNAIRRTEEPRTAQSLQRSLAALDRLIALTEQMLDLNRIDTTDDRSSQESLELGEHITALLSELQPVFTAQNIAIEQNFDAPGQVRMHPAHLHSLLQNFLTNAVRYGGPNKTLSVHQNGCTVDIVDRGPGIPDAWKDRVFDRFFRGEGDGGEGAGLGLAIVRRIADRYGVSISLKARSDGAPGLWVQLTFRPDHNPRAIPNAAHQQD